VNLTAETYGHAVVLNIKGELTEDSLGSFQREVEHQLAGRDIIDLVLNLEKAPFIDSICLEYLMDLQDQLAEKLGQVKLVRPDENVRKILEITRLAGTFETYKDTAEAVKAVQA